MGWTIAAGSIKNKGHKFTKWRATIPVIGATDDFITAIAADMAAYAHDALQNELVPIIEPELLLSGDHTVEETEESFKRVVPAVLAALAEKGCNPQHCILKTSFITDGLADGVQSADETAKRTLAVFKETKLDGKKGFLRHRISIRRTRVKDGDCLHSAHQGTC